VKFAKRLRAEAEGFPAASDTERHRLRKRLKRLRYGLELAGDLLPHKKSRQALARLKPLQDALGQYNDLCRAEAYFRQMRHSPGAWFAQGWAAARRAELLREATGAVAQWRDSKPRG
ncbi:MAG TPA: CHAD domain-containing protein, partial [Roseateles sp.]|nr:CHAD domain-containing protein [Roseateles sp.]